MFLRQQKSSSMVAPRTKILNSEISYPERGTVIFDEQSSDFEIHWNQTDGLHRAQRGHRLLAVMQQAPGHHAVTGAAATNEHRLHPETRVLAVLSRELGHLTGQNERGSLGQTQHLRFIRAGVQSSVMTAPSSSSCAGIKAPPPRSFCVEQEFLLSLLRTLLY